ncbi:MULTISPECIES: hypothetical protein [unclassified Staphylococcus]|uniref:hypothetical protein n=2 Tax=Staphylococcus TaxID=1279 RepID=UPI001AEBF3DC|nr:MULTISPECIES: hypothetical protein [unclassified Staphylococcus]
MSKSSANEFGEDETNARWDLGIRKLNTLATLPERERNEIFEQAQRSESIARKQLEK